MFERMSNGWKLAQSSFHMLRFDKELLLFPLLSMLCCSAVFASFAIPSWQSEYVQEILDGGAWLPENTVFYPVLFGFYLTICFVIVFFNAALVACAMMRFNGGHPSVADGLRAAAARVPHLLAWVLVSATVSIVLKLIESRSERAGRLAASMLGLAWSVATYFVLPVLVVESLGPRDSIRRSVSILRRGWGESLAANFGTGLVTFGLSLLAVVPTIGGMLLGTATAILYGMVATVLLWILIALATSAVNTIVLGAIYYYAVEGTVPAPFDESLLTQAFVGK